MKTQTESSCQIYLVQDFLCTDFFNKRIDLRIEGITQANFSQVKDKIAHTYGECTLVADGKQCALADLTFASSILIPGCALVDSKRFDFADFVQIMTILRAENGCEWDRAQTHESIRINLIEEAYELVEAIDMKNADMMLEECGDVLMQAIFHTAIAKDENQFDYVDMLSALCNKLITRHTHIFGSNHADNAEQALVFWNEAKKKEKKYTSTQDAMQRVPSNLPSLLYAEKVLTLAKRAGVSLDAKQTLDRYLSAVNSDCTSSMNDDVAGDILLLMVAVCKALHIDPEMALRASVRKFLQRFASLEDSSKANGTSIADCTKADFDKLWNTDCVDE